MRGSRPGERRGGRRKGTPNKATAAKAAEVAASGLTPLDFMLKTLRNDELDREVRMDAAKAAAPYCHPKLAAIDTFVGGEMTLNIVINKPAEAQP